MMSFNNIKQRIYISIDTGVQLQFTWNRCIYGEYLLPSKNQRNDLILTVCSKLERCILANIHGKVKPVLIAISYHVFNGRDIADMVFNTNQSINQSSVYQFCLSLQYTCMYAPLLPCVLYLPLQMYTLQSFFFYVKVHKHKSNVIMPYQNTII